MENYSIFLPSYSIGEDVYRDIPRICGPYGKKILAVGGHRAIASVRKQLTEAVRGSGLEIMDFLWFGGIPSYENVDRLLADERVQEADMLFAIGGGKATDTTKCLAVKAGKPFFTFPTIDSNCAACTSVAIMYNPDGSFREPFFFERPAAHTFIQTSVIVNTPDKYLWAGIGDTYAKYFECTISSRDEDLPHYEALGAAMSIQCYEPLMKYGRQALEDQRAGRVSGEFEQCVLAVIVTTAIVSTLLTAEHIIDYNTGFGHAVYYALTAFPRIGEEHLHGELVAFGILLLLLIDGQEDQFRRVYGFNRSIKLPVCMSDVGITDGDLDAVISKAVSMKDIDHNPYVITEDMVRKAFGQLEAMAAHQS